MSETTHVKTAAGKRRARAAAGGAVRHAMIPGWEGSIGPSPAQYGDPHVYARDIQSGAGNCVCGRPVGAPVHVQAAPGVPVPDWMRA